MFRFVKSVAGIALLINTLLVPVAGAANSGKAIFAFGQLPEEIQVTDLLVVPILVEPNKETLDTIRISLNFPPDKLEAIHFDLADLFPNTSPANQIDNEKGLIYQGGFRITGPTTEKGPVGAITFKAKSAGKVSLNFNDNSLLLGAGEIKNASPTGGSLDFTILEGADQMLAPANTALSAEGAVLFKVNSISHPDSARWYANSKVIMEWLVEPDAGISTFFFAFDQKPNTNPTQALPASAAQGNRLTFEQVKDGLWYFHLKGKDVQGKDTETLRYRVQVDATAPNLLAPFLERTEVDSGEGTLLNFGTVDQASGISHYVVMVDEKVLGRQISPYKLTVTKAGEHAVRVQAFDKAGNVVEGSVKLTVTGPEIAPKTAIIGLAALAGVAAVLIIIFVIKIIFNKLKRRY